MLVLLGRPHLIVIPYRIRPRKCKHCRESFMPERMGQIVHVSCIDGYLDALRANTRAKQEADRKARAKVERAVTRRRKADLLTIPDLIKLAQREFNGFIRLRDRLAGHPCISSGRPLDWAANSVDAGHYRSVGSASHLRFDERNCHAQSKHDNRYGAGRAVDYRIGLIGRIGLAEVEALEASNEPHKWQRDELIAIRDTYRRKRKELEQ